MGFGLHLVIRLCKHNPQLLSNPHTRQNPGQVVGSSMMSVCTCKDKVLISTHWTSPSGASLCHWGVNNVEDAFTNMQSVAHWRTDKVIYLLPFIFVVLGRLLKKLEGTAAYGRLLLAPAEGWWPTATWRALRALFSFRYLGGPFSYNFYLG